MPSDGYPVIHVWVTKAALTTGMFEAEAELLDETHIRLISQRVFYPSIYFSGPDWHRDLVEARARVRVMIAAKIKNVEKQRAKLERLAREYKN